jgi:hypothetical protein
MAGAVATVGKAREDGNVTLDGYALGVLANTLTSTAHGLSSDCVEAALDGLPTAHGYALHITPLRYRERPHLSAWTDFEDRSITLQVPEPFFPFGEIVPYAAKRRPSARKGGPPKFIWLTEGITFRTPREVLRFLYCHEWMHVAGSREFKGRRIGEIKCDRFALHNFLRPVVTLEDAERAIRWRYSDPTVLTSSAVTADP